MRLLLDTVAFIRAVSAPDLITERALAALNHAEASLELSAISLTEIAIKTTRGQLEMTAEQVINALSGLRVRVLPYRVSHVMQLFNLPLHHKDPFDRQIIAQALAEQIPVITSDEMFRRYEGVKVIW